MANGSDSGAPAPDEIEERELPILEAVQRRELCTLQLRRYLYRYKSVFDFFFFGIHLATRADEVRMTAAKTLASLGEEEHVEALKEVEKEPNPAQKRLNEFGALQGENILIRLVDNFLSYLSEIIQEAIKRKPQIMMSEETIKVEDVLRFSRYSDLVSYLIEKKINDLGYSGIRDIEKFVRKRTGLDMFETNDERTLTVLAIEIRNIYTHSRRVVLATMLRKLQDIQHDWKFEKGKPFGTGFDEIVQLANNMTRVARRLDEAFAKKFKIRRKQYMNYKKK